ncbi:hypothetical protein [Actinopolyspora erythraea]|uniref:hypothetical protein n=1 Tax=Actinopolyspora erythraea TaxID=414996 RepID=UPI0011871722|nr:hypothetical protein [Actinopolyspora erythraea]
MIEEAYHTASIAVEITHEQYSFAEVDKEKRYILDRFEEYYGVNPYDVTFSCTYNTSLDKLFIYGIAVTKGEE